MSPVLISTSSGAASSSTAASRGTGWPANAGENHAPASSASISDESSAASAPVPEVVRSTLTSWRT
jgi:hypothetical protein